MKHFNRIKLATLIISGVVLGLGAMFGVIAFPKETLAALPFVGLMFGTVYAESNYLGDVLLSECDCCASREPVTVLSGQNLTIGSVLGKITKSCPTTGTAGGGNTGNGTVTGVTMGALAKIGSYVLKCIGTVTGAITTPATGTAGGGNAGANTMTGVSAGAKVKAGTYNMVCIDASAAGSEIYQVTDPDGLLLPNATVAVPYVNDQIHFTINDPGANAQVNDAFSVAATAADGNAGSFQVMTPSGEVLPPATVGVAYTSPHINFTITDGATDFIVGDTFSIAVTAGSGKVKILTPAAVDGTQNAHGLLVSQGGVDASLADKAGVAVVRDAIAKDSGLVWPGGISADQKAAALAELAAKFITVRTAA